jgi:hypothetical protein
MNCLSRIVAIVRFVQELESLGSPTAPGGVFSKASDLGLLLTPGGAITPLGAKNDTETERRSAVLAIGS